ncbi:hypothetical protein SCUCBS95973_001400 [Sporothrix curviconia]|uniref:FHA domain-containing protein n=1 Tax=Sporothrix curviconia TaxID=1260050 RepID=A0ABP0AYP7_9PEZI
MWLLENAGSAFEGRRLWLRPGKRYLFGRTRAEPGQLVISDKTISRKHLTIQVGPVPDGDGTNCDSRSVVTVEDLATKIGTVINGVSQIRGQKLVLSGKRTTIKMGHMADLFTISWHPVVLSFSFSSKELRSTAPDDPLNPWTRLRRDLEPLDIKFLAEFRRDCTTHVVAKKRNTSRGLQALINGSYIVTDSFLAAVVAAAASGQLESDFDAAWPNALDHLPPRGDEPSDRPSSTYGPDPRRANLFEGYTFVFYDEKQYDNLLPPIANGRGKALLLRGPDAVVPGRTEVDDFVRYVKGVAGEQGMGEFEDGSAGRGVVVVRYVPAKGDHVEWFTRFTTAVALRLDHRLIDQREFLDAILACEPSMLRRPLEVEGATAAAEAAAAAATAAIKAPPPQRSFASSASGAAMDLDGSNSNSNSNNNDDAADPDEPQRPPPPSMSLSQASSIRRARGRRGGTTSRFKGFDADLISDDEEDGGNALVALKDLPPSQGDDGMFVSQQHPDTKPAAEQPARRGKRSAAAAAAASNNKEVENSDDEDDVMDDIAPTAAAVKRRRIEAGVAPVPPRMASDDEMDQEEDEEADEKPTKKGKAGAKAVAIKKEKAENDILDQARRNREAAEKRLADERERLAELPDDGLDAEAIRKLTLVETIAVRVPQSGGRQRNQQQNQQQNQEQNAASSDGRWKPEWNGRRNFKKFRKQGDVVGRPPPRVIVALEPAKTKEYGIGDGYWLEGGDEQRQTGHQGSLRELSNSGHNRQSGRLDENGKEATPSIIGSAASRRGGSVDSAPVAQVEAGVVPDTDPEDGHDKNRRHGGRAAVAAPTAQTSRRNNSSVEREDSPPSVLSSNATTSQADLPRTRAGKVAARTAAVRQSQASQARTTPASSAAAAAAVAVAGDPSSMTSSSLLIFDTPPPSTQDSSAPRGAKRQPAAAPATAAPLAKRPRRGAGTASSSGTISSGSRPGPVTIPDSDDEDDGLKFKFRSRR